MPSYVTITKWDAAAVVSMARAKLRPRMARLGRVLADRVRENIGTPTAQAGPSLPGEFPHRDTGDLYRSVSDEMSGDDLIISAKAPHAEYVEIDRPFLRRTLYENEHLIADLLQNG